METLPRCVLAGMLLVLTLASGVWLSHVGKPYNGLLLNLHKLIALGGVIAVVIQLAAIPNLLGLFPRVAVCLGLGALSIVALFASGALMSAGKLDHALMIKVHWVASVVLVVGLICGIAYKGIP